MFLDQLFQSIGADIERFGPIAQPVWLMDAMEMAVNDVKNGRQMRQSEAVDMKKFEEIISLKFWAQIENKYPV